MHELLEDGLDEANEKYEEQLERISAFQEEGIEDSVEEVLNSMTARRWVQGELIDFDKLKAEGCIKTYTIEGILSDEVNRMNEAEDVTIVLPLDKYFAFTDTDETMNTGMMYHFPLMATIIALLTAILIFCGSAYTSLRGMGQDVASDLATAGE